MKKGSCSQLPFFIYNQKSLILVKPRDMKKLLATVLLISCSAAMYAQTMVLHDPVSARTFNTSRYSQIQGTPFLNDKWTKGSVLTPRGIYQNLDLKLDAYSSTLYFNRDEKLFEFEDHITGFVLMPQPADSSTYLRFRKGLQASGLKPEQWVQILSEGKTSLFKLESKLVSDMNQINQGVVQTFTNSTRYYVMKAGELKMVKFNKSDILDVFADKKDQVQAYINQQSLGFKRESDVIRMFNYYNAL